MKLWIRAGLCAMAVSALAFGASETEDSGTTDKPQARVHIDAGALEKATAALTRAVIRDDLTAVQAALEAMQPTCSQLTVEDREVFGADIRSLDLAFHSAMNRCRENAFREDLDAVFEDAFWVQRTCRTCHQVARDTGRLPASGPLWSAERSDQP